MSESASTTSGASAPDDKTATVKYKPATSLAGNNNALAHYEQSRGYDQISHALSNIHGLYGWSCNLLDVISVYSLNPGKLPGRFSYERPGYEASIFFDDVILTSLLPPELNSPLCTLMSCPRTLNCSVD